MFPRIPALALLTLTALKAAKSQFTTISMFPEDAYVDGLKGEIVGTGADGTTYIVSGTISDFAFTETIVEDETYFSQDLAVETSSMTLRLDQACGLESAGDGTGSEILKNAECTAIMNIDGEGFHLATTTTDTATAVLFGPVEFPATETPTETPTETKISYASTSFGHLSLGAGLLSVIASTVLLVY